MSFRFKYFEIEDDLCAQKVGTDSVILGAWVNLRGTRTVLDVGAGSGILALMIAQRLNSSNASIDAVEIDPKAGENCASNFKNSAWGKNLTLFQSDFSDIEGNYDLIISNPPYFSGYKDAEGEARKLARQGVSLNYFSLIAFASGHLNAEGRIAFISDCRHYEEIIYTAQLKRLTPVRICFIYGKEGGAAKRILWEFGHVNIKDPISKEGLYILDSSGKPTQEYIDLTKNFYLDRWKNQFSK